IPHRHDALWIVERNPTDLRRTRTRAYHPHLMMLLRHFAAALVVIVTCASSACSHKPPTPRNACVWTPKTPIRGVSEICRDDMTTTTCIARDSDVGPPAFT